VKMRLVNVRQESKCIGLDASKETINMALRECLDTDFQSRCFP